MAARLVGRTATAAALALSALALVPAAHAEASSAGGPANCQLAMATPRAAGHTVTAIVQVSCSSPVELTLTGAVWRARGNGAQKMAVVSQSFHRSTTARMTVLAACPSGTTAWMSTGNASYTVKGTTYLLGSISARHRLGC